MESNFFELLQNADNENSKEILTELNLEKSLLTIVNRGHNCKQFSKLGIQSLMISDLSQKNLLKK